MFYSERIFVCIFRMPGGISIHVQGLNFHNQRMKNQSRIPSAFILNLVQDKPHWSRGLEQQATLKPPLWWDLGIGLCFLNPRAGQKDRGGAEFLRVSSRWKKALRAKVALILDFQLWLCVL
jgi:hypothetical protein